MKVENIKILKGGGIGVILTDTIFGIVGLADSPVAVKRISEIKKRDADKGYIILISSFEDLKDFGVEVSERAKIFLKKFWPGPVSVIFSVKKENFLHLIKPNNTLAFRMPNNTILLNLLNEIGPMVAPSANPQGFPPAKNVSEAKKYFGDEVDFYEDKICNNDLSSTVIKIVGDEIEIIREGAIKIKKEDF
ncbi:MAG: L-threonylcarbamoyladenylate synthase [Minisyncoccia bacterium]